jgi:hypothetical protein
MSQKECTDNCLQGTDLSEIESLLQWSQIDICCPFSDFLFLFLSLSDPLLPTHCKVWRFIVAADHTEWQTETHTLGKTPLDEGSARRRDLYLYDTQHSQQTSRRTPSQIRRNPSKQVTARPLGSAIFFFSFFFFLLLLLLLLLLLNYLLTAG